MQQRDCRPPHALSAGTSAGQAGLSPSSHLASALRTATLVCATWKIGRDQALRAELLMRRQSTWTTCAAREEAASLARSQCHAKRSSANEKTVWSLRDRARGRACVHPSVTDGLALAASLQGVSLATCLLLTSHRLCLAAEPPKAMQRSLRGAGCPRGDQAAWPRPSPCRLRSAAQGALAKAPAPPPAPPVCRWRRRRSSACVASLGVGGAASPAEHAPSSVAGVSPKGGWENRAGRRVGKAELFLVRTDGFTCTRESVQGARRSPPSAAPPLTRPPDSQLLFNHPSTQQQMLIWKTRPTRRDPSRSALRAPSSLTSPQRAGAEKAGRRPAA